MIKLEKSLLLTLMLVVFLDIGNFFMPMPIYTPLFIQSNFLHSYSYEMRSILLGFVIACYGLAQLFGGPIFGELSDQYGRKKILIFSLCLSIIGCVLSGISLTIGSILMVFISRFLIGLSSGTIAVIFALTADYSNVNERPKNMGYITLGQSIGATLTPIIGGYLTGIHFDTSSYQPYAIPFYFMGVLYLLSVVLIIKLLPQDKPFRQKNKIHLFTGFQNAYKAFFRSSLLRQLILMAIFFQIGSESFYLAAPIFAVKKLHMSGANIANCLMFFGITAAITSSWLNKNISQYFSSATIFLVSILLMTIAFFILPFSASITMITICFILFGIAGPLCWIHSNNLFSQAVDNTEQGLIFGVAQLLWSFGGIIGSILIGTVAAAHYKASTICPAIFTILALIIAIKIVGKKDLLHKSF
ncbi:MAG: arabinose efflux permease family protein [Gammaproteobacteria bacterium]|jgi:DHA1 family multidrug resistance protein-like MFS transporter|nr:arabinose efflux permease family protein [Gammaproteobacteria bacterium]